MTAYRQRTGRFAKDDPLAAEDASEVVDFRLARSRRVAARSPPSNLHPLAGVSDLFPSRL
jgi:hypothetical protein